MSNMRNTRITNQVMNHGASIGKRVAPLCARTKNVKENVLFSIYYLGLSSRHKYVSTMSKYNTRTINLVDLANSVGEQSIR